MFHVTVLPSSFSFDDEEKKKSQKKSLMRCSLPEASYNFAIFVTKDSGQKIKKWWLHTQLSTLKCFPPCWSPFGNFFSKILFVNFPNNTSE